MIFNFGLHRNKNSVVSIRKRFIKVLRCKKGGDVHEKFDFLENTRIKTLEHLLKTF